mgnify:CR=1 FL=1
MEKNKKLIVLGVLALILIISGITYAILTWTSSKINIGLTSNCFTIDYTKGNDIANASIKALNESDLISDNKFTIKEGIALTYANIGIKSTCTIEGYGSLYLNVTTLSSAFSTGNSKGALKYAVLDNTSTTSTVTVASLLNQQFNIVSKGSITNTGKITLLTKQLSNTKLNKYLIVIYADVSKIVNDAMDASFNGTVSADANQGNIAKITLTSLNLSPSRGTPNFTKTSIDDKTNGIYSAKDDLGTSYYFRGNVTNNYVKFANKYWRIIRINGDGTIRMIYAGTSAHANGYNDSSANDMSIGTSAFNSSRDDNTYVGYMYGTKGASTYANTHSNTTNSTIKTKLDSWYDTNIVNTGNEKYIADAIYCNDRSVSSGTGIGTTNTTYAAQTRGNNGQPTLKCANNNDKFTKSTTIGNGKLTKMIGLITSDEVIYAGGKSGTYNQEYYLYSGTSYWTMAPYSYASDRARVYIVNYRGNLSDNSVSNAIAVRPVVSLKSDAISGGSGTAASPFLVG